MKTVNIAKIALIWAIFLILCILFLFGCNSKLATKTSKNRNSSVDDRLRIRKGLYSPVKSFNPSIK